MDEIIAREILLRLAAAKTVNQNRLDKLKRRAANQHKVGMIPNAALLFFYDKLIKRGGLPERIELRALLQKRKIRTLSGVAPVAVLTKPFPCPGHCLFCPLEKNIPKSYLSNEPAVMRAVRANFDPFKQTASRLEILKRNGHATDKIELIVMGGTWSALPKTYQKNFIKRCFDACNGRLSPTLAQAQKRNETATSRIVALTLETRPDQVTEETVKFWRKLGATKIELGVQILNNKILAQNLRGETMDTVVRATALLKQAGFKIAYHLMPALHGATPRADLAAYEKLWSDPRFRPDFIKIYPTVVVRGSRLYALWKKGIYRPYSERALFNLLLKMKLATPPYARIIRLIRDIPKESIEAGNQVTNLREHLQTALKKQGHACRCIRCREARENLLSLNKARYFQTVIKNIGATEYFLEYASPDKKKLYAFLRLRLPALAANFIPEIQGAAMIREVHTYGRVAPLKKTTQKAIQHSGFGTLLTNKAEALAAAAGFNKMAVISGVGVRGFYRRLGYRLAGTYMIKRLASPLKKSKIEKPKAIHK